MADISAFVAPVAGLAGVLVGVFLQQRVQRQSWLRTERRTLYAQFLDVGGRLRSTCDELHGLCHAQRASEAIPSTVSTLHELRDRLKRCLNEIDLVGSEPVVETAALIFWEGAVCIYDAAGWRKTFVPEEFLYWWDSPDVHGMYGGGVASLIDEGLDEFVRRARRELAGTSPVRSKWQALTRRWRGWRRKRYIRKRGAGRSD